MHPKLRDILYILLFVIALVFGVYMFVNMQFREQKNKDYEIICLGGHEYWRMNFIQKTAVTIKLNDDGKPIKCNED